MFYYGYMNDLNHPQSKRVGLKHLALISRTAERGLDQPVHFLKVRGGGGDGSGGVGALRSYIY